MEAAAGLVERVQARFADEPESLKLLARLARARGDRVAALAYARSALGKAPGDAEAVELLGALGGP